MHMIDSKQELLRHHVSAASSSSQKAMFQHRCWWFCWFIEPVTFAPWTFKSGKSPQIGLHSSTSQSVLGKTRCDKCFSCLWYNFVFECCWMKQNLAKICSQEGIDLFSIGFCANLLQTLGNVTRNDTKSNFKCNLHGCIIEAGSKTWVIKASWFCRMPGGSAPKTQIMWAKVSFSPLESAQLV